MFMAMMIHRFLGSSELVTTTPRKSLSITKESHTNNISFLLCPQEYFVGALRREKVFVVSN